jgi:hypothetical protein
MQDHLRALLLESLAQCPGPLCLDLGEDALRSSNSQFLQRLSWTDAADLAADLKRAAGLDPALERPQSGTFVIGTGRFQINCCPQTGSGEIIILHRLYA